MMIDEEFFSFNIRTLNKSRLNKKLKQCAKIV